MNLLDFSGYTVFVILVEIVTDGLYQ